MTTAQRIRGPRNFRWAVGFEPRDLWVGLFWDREDIGSAGGLFGTTWRFYLCVVPMFPLIVTFDTGGEDTELADEEEQKK